MVACAAVGRQKTKPGWSSTPQRFVHSTAVPVGVKLLIEGEEEAGSTNLDAFIDEYGDLLAADVVVIASKSHVGIDHLDWISDSFTLSAGEADAITDYTDLRIRFDITFDAGISGDLNARVTWAELEVPGAP